MLFFLLFLYPWNISSLHANVKTKCKGRTVYEWMSSMPEDEGLWMHPWASNNKGMDITYEMNNVSLRLSCK